MTGWKCGRFMRIVLFIMAGWSLAVGLIQADDEFRPANILEYSTFLTCHYNCPPYAATYFNYCFQLDNQIIIGNSYGSQPEYDAEQIKKMPRDLPIHFDSKNIWVIGLDGNEHKLKRLKSSTHFKNQSRMRRRNEGTSGISRRQTSGGHDCLDAGGVRCRLAGFVQSTQSGVVGVRFGEPRRTVVCLGGLLQFSHSFKLDVSRATRLLVGNATAVAGRSGHGYIGRGTHPGYPR